MLSQERGQRLFQGISFVETPGNLQQQTGRRRNATTLGHFDPVGSLGKIHDRHHVEQVGFDLGKG